MDKHESFAADVIRAFKFLEDEYALRREPHHIGSDGSWISYTGTNVTVIVEYEAGGSCGVSVRDLRFIKRDPLDRGEFDLEEIVALGGNQRQQGRRPDPRSMSEAVNRAAQTLRTAGAPVLGGEFAQLHERQRKNAEALRKHNPLTGELEPPPDNSGSKETRGEAGYGTRRKR
jgi:hypothetical protein